MQHVLLAIIYFFKIVYGDFHLDVDTSKYLPLEQIDEFLLRLQKGAGEVLSVKTIGNTALEGKDMKHDIELVTIGNKEDPILFFDCGIHAREWIAPATCLYLISKLARSFKGNHQRKINRKEKKYGESYSNLKKEYQKVEDEISLYNYQWQFIPVLNPDGYATTFIKDVPGQDKNRMHRKNRRPFKQMRNLTSKQLERCDDEGNCDGVDLNRNFPGGWGQGHSSFIKESTEPSTSVYKGYKPLSEKETKALNKHFNKIKHKTLLAISVHSYGKDIYYPKGYLPTDHPDQIKGREKKYLKDFAEYFNQELGFRIGSVAELLSPHELCGGATDDYYWTTQGINLTYTIELHPHIEYHQIGFQLPPEQIRSVGRKMWGAIKKMAQQLDKLYPWYSKTHWN